MSHNYERQNDVKEIESLDSIEVSYNTRITATTAVRKSLSWVIDEIRSSGTLQRDVSHIRSLKDADARRKAKQEKLPWFSFVKFRDNRRLNESFAGTKFILIDVDHIGVKLAEVREKIRNDGDVFLSFLSPSGDGLKVAFELEDEIAETKEYRTAFAHFRKLITDRYGVDTDTDDDPARACFFSFDPELHLYLGRRRQPKTWNVGISDSPVRRAKSQGSGINAAFEGSGPGGRTDKATQIVGYLNTRGIEEEVAVEILRHWNNEKNDPPLEDEKIEYTVRDMYARYAEQAKGLPAQFVVRNNSYFKKSKDGGSFTENHITNFTITPKELLVLPDGDCLTCTVNTSAGYSFDDIMIETEGWTSKVKLLNAIGHQDCNFFGSDGDVQKLCSFVNSQNKVRKEGTRTVGIVGDTWVTDGWNITASGFANDLTIVPYEKGEDAFYRKIAYDKLDDVEYAGLVSGLYSDILRINSPTTILPLLGWMFAAPMRQRIIDYKDAFPILFMPGSMGNGKSSTGRLFMRLHGYRKDNPFAADMKAFPTLKALSASNGVPVFFDEFKEKDMREAGVDEFYRYIRRAYDNSLESKGRADQTTIDYEFKAPMVIMGESSLSQPAIKERLIMPRFTDVVKKDVEMQRAFARLERLPLEGFMPRYIQFCLGQDIRGMYDDALAAVETLFAGMSVAPRIKHNLAVVVLGLELFFYFGKQFGMAIPAVNLEEMLHSQLEAITGNKSGFVKSAVDQLIEELGIMIQKNEKPDNGYATQTPWWTVATVGSTKVLAIRFNKVYPEFKEYAQRTQYEGDLLDKEAYMKMFDETPYVVGKSVGVKFDDGKASRALCIDVAKAKTAGLDLEGFGIA